MNPMDRRLQFKGYGNPAGLYWFIGIEERGSPKGLAAREHFEEVEDLARAHSKELLNFPLTTLIPTWATMSRIVLRLDGENDWTRTSRVRKYQAERLGRFNGETFLADLLPLPATSTAHWHYADLYPDRETYVKALLPKRQEMLRGLFLKYRPKYVFCYGKGMWEEFSKVFEVEFRAALDGYIKVASLGNSAIVLTPFFFYYLMTINTIDRVALLLDAMGL